MCSVPRTTSLAPRMRSVRRKKKRAGPCKRFMGTTELPPTSRGYQTSIARPQTSQRSRDVRRFMAEIVQAGPAWYKEDVHASLLTRFGAWAARHPWRVVGAWVLVLGAALPLAARLPG